MAARRDRALALGDEEATIPYTAEFKRFGILQVEPVRSVQTGKEIADNLQTKVDDLAGQIAGLEAELGELAG
jgi:hypothetical protein